MACAQFPSLSRLAPTPEKALAGIRRVVGEVVADMQAAGEPIPAPLSERQYSGRLVDCLLQTLNPPDEAHAAAWAAVARRRLDELRSGKVAAIVGEEVFARIRQMTNREGGIRVQY